MPSYKIHLAFGLFIGIIFSIAFKSIWYLPIAMLYSILPDIDINTSTIFKMYLIASCLLAIYLIVYFSNNALAKIVSIAIIATLIILQLVHHRGFFHSFGAGLLLSLPMIYFFNLIGFAAAFSGYISHLALDHFKIDKKKQRF